MRRNIVFSGVILLLFIGFCVQAQQNTAGKPVVPVAEILKDVRSWVVVKEVTHAEDMIRALNKVL